MNLFLRGGGVGFPSPYVLACDWVAGRSDPCALIFGLGRGKATDLGCRHELGNLGVDLRIATDDGSEGPWATCIDVARDVQQMEPGDGTVLVCGVLSMLAVGAWRGAA